MKKSLILGLICLSVSLPSFAMTYKNTIPANQWWSPSRLYVAASGGYGRVDGGYSNDGDVVQGRLALGIHAVDYQLLSFGLEAGVQSGNDMRLSAPFSVMEAIGGLPIQSTLKPLVDVLVTAKSQFTANCPLFAFVKAGIAFRQLQLNDRTSSRDALRKVNGELQAGLGYNVTEHAMLTAFYQGIYSNSNAGIALNTAGDVTISHIPTQQAGFIGIEYSL